MKTIREWAEACVSYWNPTNFRGRDLTVGAVEKYMTMVITDEREHAAARAEIERLTRGMP